MGAVLRVVCLMPGASPASPDVSPASAGAFKFFSVYKWEFRKGWDVLVSAFARAFKREDNVLLYLLTRQWDAAVGTAYHAAVERHLKANEPSLSSDDVVMVLSRIRIVTRVQQVRGGDVDVSSVVARWQMRKR